MKYCKKSFAVVEKSQKSSGLKIKYAPRYVILGFKKQFMTRQLAEEAMDKLRIQTIIMRVTYYGGNTNESCHINRSSSP